MFDEAAAAVEGALAAGAAHADARGMVVATEVLHARGGALEAVRRGESAGIGVRARLGSAWGFFAVPEPSSAEARAAGAEAAAIARASALAPGPPLELAPVAPVEARWASGFQEHPFAVSLAEKGDLLCGATATMAAVAGVAVAEAHLATWDTHRWLVSSEGHRIAQHLVQCGVTMRATAVGEGESQRRSHGAVGGSYGSRGYELVRAADLGGQAERVATEAVALLSAPECPATTTDLVLGPEQLALQIHESVGHATELDRILGWEAAFAGTSFLDLGGLGSFRYGSEAMNVVADATIEGALGTFGYDDEGTPAQRVDLVRDGTWVGVLSGRDSAAVAGVAPGGMVRAESWSRLPIVRMTNVGLVPGTSSLEEMVAATDDGILMETNRSWSIDDRRLNFQFGCEVGYEIRRGRRGRLLRNPTYTGITPRFWRSMDLVGNAAEQVLWGTPNCGKGQPMQIGFTGHPAVPARFRGVRVGVRGR